MGVALVVPVVSSLRMAPVRRGEEGSEEGSSSPDARSLHCVQQYVTNAAQNLFFPFLFVLLVFSLVSLHRNNLVEDVRG